MGFITDEVWEEYKKRVMAKAKAPDSPKGEGEVTLEDVQEYPEYYLVGDGYVAACNSKCPHGYDITSSCPMCP